MSALNMRKRDFGELRRSIHLDMLASLNRSSTDVQQLVQEVQQVDGTPTNSLEETLAKLTGNQPTKDASTEATTGDADDSPVLSSGDAGDDPDLSTDVVHDPTPASPRETTHQQVDPLQEDDPPQEESTSQVSVSEPVQIVEEPKSYAVPDEETIIAAVNGVKITTSVVEPSERILSVVTKLTLEYTERD
jgi:hypothetical protein